MNKQWLERATRIGFTVKIIILLIGLSVLATITEMFGLSIFLPIFQYIRLEGDVAILVAESEVWKFVVDVFSHLGLDVTLVSLLLLSFSFFLGRQLFNYLRLVYRAAVMQKITKNMCDRLFDRYLSADATYHDEHSVGDLVNAMTTETKAAFLGLVAPIDLVVFVFMAIGYLIFLSLLSWKMTVLSVVILLMASLLPRMWVRMSAKTGRKLAYANTAMSSFLVGRLKSPRIVRLAGTEKAEQEEFYRLTQAQRKHYVTASVLQAKTEVVLDPVVIGISLLFLYVAYTYMQLQIEVIGLYLVIALRLMPVVKGIVLQWQTVQRYLGSVEIIENRMNAMEDAREIDSGSVQLSDINDGVIFKNVSYKYQSSEKSALDGISINIKSHEMTAVVGPSGSGKSTLVDLLPRLRTPSNGMIFMDETPIIDIELDALRGAISYAPQNPQIFDGTIEHHIRYGRPMATNEEVREAAFLSGADKFIDKLPLKYQTLLGEDAVNLSGGQRQRLDLARALISNTPFLILDEPTSNLDAESEEAFHQALIRIRKETQTTIIIVAHRLASISDADQIIVLKQGRVEATGTHDELMSNDGWYAKAWRMQSDS